MTKPKSENSSPSFIHGIIGVLVGAIITGSVSIYITNKNIDTNRQILTGNNLQRDKETLFENINEIISCYNTVTNILMQDSTTDYYSKELFFVFQKQWEVGIRLTLVAPKPIAVKTASLNLEFSNMNNKLINLGNNPSQNARMNIFQEYSEMFYDWLGFSRIKMKELNIITMPDMDTLFVNEIKSYQNILEQNKPKQP